MAIDSVNSANFIAKLGKNLDKGGAAAGRFKNQFETGFRIGDVQEDSAEKVLLNTYRSSNSSYDAATRSAINTNALTSQVSGASSELSSIAASLATFADLAAVETTPSSQRTALDQEATELATRYSEIVSETKLNGKTLLDGSANSIQIKVGPGEGDSVQYSPPDISKLNSYLSGLDLSTQSAAETSYDDLSILYARTDVGLASADALSSSLSTGFIQSTQGGAIEQRNIDNIQASDVEKERNRLDLQSSQNSLAQRAYDKSLELVKQQTKLL